MRARLKEQGIMMLRGMRMTGNGDCSERCFKACQEGVICALEPRSGETGEHPRVRCGRTVEGFTAQWAKPLSGPPAQKLPWSVSITPLEEAPSEQESGVFWGINLSPRQGLAG